MESHFTSGVDEGTGTGSVRNATHTRAVESHFTIAWHTCRRLMKTVT